MLRKTVAAGAAVCALLAASSLQATMVRQLNLDEMCDRAGRIVRATVVDVKPTTIHAGGAELAAHAYRLDVAEVLKGQSLALRNDAPTVVTMITGERLAPMPGSSAAVMPQLEVGREYLLLLTAESRIGLSSPVGLGQGTFVLSRIGEKRMAHNELGNRGLFRGMASAPKTTGALSYEDLSARIRELLSE